MDVAADRESGQAAVAAGTARIAENRLAENSCASEQTTSACQVGRRHRQLYTASQSGQSEAARRRRRSIKEQPRVGLSGKPPDIPPTPPSVPPQWKPPLPPPKSEPRYKWPGHRTAAEAEEALARTVHSLPDEVVVHWANPSRQTDRECHEPTRKPAIFFHRIPIRGKPRPLDSTFQADPTRKKAISQAADAIQKQHESLLKIRNVRWDNLPRGNASTRTVGAGNARNSTLKLPIEPVTGSYVGDSWTPAAAAKFFSGRSDMRGHC